MKDLDQYLKSVSDRAGNATEGPWHSNKIDNCGDRKETPSKSVRSSSLPFGYNIVANCLRAIYGNKIPDQRAKDNASFIAHSRQDIPLLVGLLRAAINLRERVWEVDEIPEPVHDFDAKVKELLEEKS